MLILAALGGALLALVLLFVVFTVLSVRHTQHLIDVGDPRVADLATYRRESQR